MKKKLSTLFLALAVLLVPIAVVACGGNVEGTFTENGIVYEVANHSATVIGAEEGATEATISTEIKGATVDRIAEEAFKDNTILTKLAFVNGDYSLVISSNAFYNSNIETIENLPANTTLSSKALFGLKNLKSISVQGEGELSVENGALVENGDGYKALILLPAGVAPQTNFEDGTYTLTGYTQVNAGSGAFNQFITDIVIAEDVYRLNADAFSYINLNSVTVMSDDTFIDSLAFTSHKDLKVYINATSSDFSGFMRLSKNYVYGHEWLVHPIGCTDSSQHMHGEIDGQVPASYESLEWSLRGEDGFSVETSAFGGVTIMGTLPSYMLETYEEAIA